MKSMTGASLMLPRRSDAQFIGAENLDRAEAWRAKYEREQKTRVA